MSATSESSCWGFDGFRTWPQGSQGNGYMFAVSATSESSCWGFDGFRTWPQGSQGNAYMFAGRGGHACLPRPKAHVGVSMAFGRGLKEAEGMDICSPDVADMLLVARFRVVLVALGLFLNSSGLFLNSSGLCLSCPGGPGARFRVVLVALGLVSELSWWPWGSFPSCPGGPGARLRVVLVALGLVSELSWWPWGSS